MGVPSLQQVMNRHPLTLAPETPLGQAIEAMQSGGGSDSCVLVVENHQLLGLVTSQELIPRLLNFPRKGTLTLADVMVPPPWVIHEAELKDAPAVIQRMRQHQIAYLPVVDERQRVVGLVTPLHGLQVVPLAGDAIAPSEEAAIAPRSAQEGDRTPANLALHQAQQRYQTLVNSLSGIVWEADPQTLQYDFVSQQAEAILGYPLAAWLEPNFWIDHLHPEDRDTTVAACRQAIARQRDHDLEYRMVAADGRIVWIYDAVRVVAEPNASLKLVGFMLDTTHQQQMRTQLQERDQAYRALVENSPDIIERFDTQLRHLYISPRLTQVTGLPAEVFLGKTCRELNMAESMVNTWEPAAQALLATGQRQLIEFEVETLQGIRSFEMAIAPELTHDQAIESILCISRDVTDRKRAETALQQLNRELEQRVQDRTEALQQQAEQERLLRFITQHIHQSFDLDRVLATVLSETRQTLRANRVALYRFNPDWSGSFVAESVEAGWVPLVGPDICKVWEDTHLQSTRGGRYRNRQTFAIHDIYQASLTPCHVDLLVQFQARAFAIAPIFVQDTLWGLLAAYQNDGPRPWRPWEMNLLQQISLQTAIAIQQSDLFQQVQTNLATKELLVEIAEIINRSVHLDEVLESCLEPMRRFLGCDRVMVYRFQEQRQGVIEKEAFARPELSALGHPLASLCSIQELADYHRQGGVALLDSQHPDALPVCYATTLAQMQVQANLTVPIFHGQQLWGLLLAQHLNAPHTWQSFEIEMLKRVGLEIGIAIQKAELYTQLKNELRQKEVLIKEVHHRVKNNLQVISSLLNLQSASIEQDAILQPFIESQRRISVMAMIHERLYRSGDLASLNFADYVQDLVEDVFRS